MSATKKEILEVILKEMNANFDNNGKELKADTRHETIPRTDTNDRAFEGLVIKLNADYIGTTFPQDPRTYFGKIEDMADYVYDQQD